MSLKASDKPYWAAGRCGCASWIITSFKLYSVTSVLFHHNLILQRVGWGRCHKLKWPKNLNYQIGNSECIHLLKTSRFFCFFLFLFLFFVFCFCFCFNRILYWCSSMALCFQLNLQKYVFLSLMCFVGIPPFWPKTFLCVYEIRLHVTFQLYTNDMYVQWETSL